MVNVGAVGEARQAASERALDSAVATRAACGRYADERRPEWLLRTRLLLGCFVRPRASQAVPGEIDPVRVVDEPIEDGIGVSGIADQLVPFVDGYLAGDDRRSAAIAFFENLEQFVTCGGIEGLESPVIEDE